MGFFRRTLAYSDDAKGGRLPFGLVTKGEKVVQVFHARL